MVKPGEMRDAVTVVLIAVHSEECLLNLCRRLPAEARRRVLGRLIERGDQRAVCMWEDACAASC